MSHFPCRGHAIALPPRYLGSVAYYAAMAAYPHVYVDVTMRFDKRAKAVHRCDLADTHGLRSLTVPIEKPLSMTGARWEDITLSAHGAWWHVHLETLRSAYGRTPFFEYYVDDFAPLFTSGSAGMKLCDFNQRLDAIMRRCLMIESEVICGAPPQDGEIDDYRRRPLDFVSEKPYYQVRALSQGFIPGLTAADLLFNLGPEAPLHLAEIIRG